MKLAVLASGTGSLLEAMLTGGLKVDLVIADRPCRAIDEVAPAYGILRELVLRTDYGKNFDREGYTKRIMDVLAAHRIDLVAMAGFMTVFHPSIFKTYENRILNTHPSILPAFKGNHAVRDALAAGEFESGCTIHVATAELDAGVVLAQEKVPVMPSDTVETLHERIKVAERTLYPKVISAYAARLKLS